MMRRLCFLVVVVGLAISVTAVATEVTVNGSQIFFDTYETDTLGGGPTPADVGVWGWTGGTVVNYDSYEGANSLEITNDTGAAGPYAGVTSADDVVHFTTMIQLPSAFTNWWDWQFQAKNATETVTIFNLAFASFLPGDVTDVAGRIISHDGSDWIDSGLSLPLGEWARFDIEYVNGASTFTLQVNGGTAETMDAQNAANLSYFSYFGNAADTEYDTLWDAVPEPATIALLGLGGLALLRRKR